MSNQALVPGSIADKALKTKTSIAEIFLHLDVVVLIDVSASMSCKDASGGRERYEVATEELARLQRENPGKVAVVAFSDKVLFCPAGIPVFMKSGTNLHLALDFIKPADDCGIKLWVISDGEPNDETSCISRAKLFKTKIDTIYIGPEDGPGRAFLRRLAAATGGISTVQKTQDLNQLSSTMKKLLSSGR